MAVVTNQRHPQGVDKDDKPWKDQGLPWSWSRNPASGEGNEAQQVHLQGDYFTAECQHLNKRINNDIQIYCASKITKQCFTLSVGSPRSEAVTCSNKEVVIRRKNVWYFVQPYSAKETPDKPYRRSFLLSFFTRPANRNSHVYLKG